MGTTRDLDLNRSIKREDHESWNRLAGTYSRSVFSICYGILGNIHDAEDLAQETFLRGFRTISSLRDNERFLPWLQSIARNASLDFLRRKERKEVPLSDIVVKSGPGNSVHQDYLDLQRAIRALPETHRLPLVLYYLDGHDARSIAEILDISQAVVHKRLSLARKEIREFLREKGESS